MTKKNFKEMRFRPNIAEHDLNTKINQIRRFLTKQLQVRIVVQMFGRENLYKDSAVHLLDKISTATADLGKMDPNRKLNGNAYFANIMPLKDSKVNTNGKETENSKGS